MVRKYIRKTNQQQWGRSELIEAVSAVTKNGMPMKVARKKFNIPKTTLVRWCEKAKFYNIENFDMKLGRFKNVFTEEQEYNLNLYIKYLQYSLCELNSLELRRIAFQFAEMNNISHTFNRDTQLAGQDWFTNFLKRNNDIVPSPANSEYFSEFNDVNSIEKFFDFLTFYQQLYKFSSNCIYNVNETAYISIPSLNSRFKNVTDKHTSNSELITIITCCNATGTFIPPLIIFPTNIEDPEFVKKCPRGSKIVCHPSGSVQNEIFFPIWFYHFLDYVKPTYTDPILLLLNGHTMHVQNLKFIEKAQETNIQILSIPVNIGHKLHPLEFHFMEDLKKYYCEEHNKWIQRNKTQFINLINVGEIFGVAYTKAAVPSNAIDGFQASGIYPLNRYIYSNTENTSQTTPLIMEILVDSVPTPINNNVIDISTTQNENYSLIIKEPSEINNMATDDIEINIIVLDNEAIDNENIDSNYSIQSMQEIEVPVDMTFVDEIVNSHYITSNI